MKLATIEEYNKFVDRYNRHLKDYENGEVRKVSALRKIFCIEDNAIYTTVSYTVTYDFKESNRYVSQKWIIKVEGYI